jgi:hypothetical protein
LNPYWSVKVKKNFIIYLDKGINHIRTFPESSQRSEIGKGIHQFIVKKQTTLYFRFDSKTIQIITIFDNRMDPENLRKSSNKIHSFRIQASEITLF